MCKQTVCEASMYVRILGMYENDRCVCTCKPTCWGTMYLTRPSVRHALLSQSVKCVNV